MDESEIAASREKEFVRLREWIDQRAAEIRSASQTEWEEPGPHEDVAGEDDGEEPPEAESFRARYRLMVDELVEDWYDRNQGSFDIPPEERERIEAYCESELQHQWRVFWNRRGEETSRAPISLPGPPPQETQEGSQEG